VARRARAVGLAGLGSEFDGPEARGRAEEFEADQVVSGLRFHHAGDAAGQLFVGLHVRNQKFLGRHDFAREGEQSTVGADVYCDGVFDEGLIVRVAVDKNGQERVDAVVMAPVRF
jgi:hypothetical protein